MASYLKPSVYILLPLIVSSATKILNNVLVLSLRNPLTTKNHRPILTKLHSMEDVVEENLFIYQNPIILNSKKDWDTTLIILLNYIVSSCSYYFLLKRIVEIYRFLVIQIWLWIGLINSLYVTHTHFATYWMKS